MMLLALRYGRRPDALIRLCFEYRLTYWFLVEGSGLVGNTEKHIFTYVIHIFTVDNGKEKENYYIMIGYTLGV